jgi:Protein of unknown function (DUF3237)
MTFMPALGYLFTVTAAVSAPLDVGLTPVGERRMIPILGGTVEGPRMSGIVIPGGTDYQIIRDPGLAEIHARYVLESKSGARVYVENTGIRRGDPEDIARLRRGETVDSALIYFRTAPRFETSAPEFAWLMRSLFVCVGTRHPDKVEIAFYEVQ